MITTKLDPISLNDVTDIENPPFMIKGEGSNALKICFESEANKQEYINTLTQGSVDMPEQKKHYDKIAGYPDTGSIALTG